MDVQPPAGRRAPASRGFNEPMRTLDAILPRGIPMSRLDLFTDRALDLANSAGDSLRHVVPESAKGWFETGVKLGALKGGARMAGLFVRRNPAIVVATAAGAGLLWYAARRRARQAREAPIDGSAKRVEARRPARPARKTSARKRSATKTSDSE